MPQTVIASQHQALIKVSGFPADYYFDTFTGGHKTRPVTPHYPGGSKNPILVGARPTWENITVTKGYDPTQDPAILRFIAAAIDLGDPVGVSVTPTRADGSRAYQATNYLCLVVTLTKPDWDSNATATSSWGMTLAVAGEA